MKTILKLSAVVAFMLSTVVSMANETKSSLTASFNAKSMIFQLDGLSNETSITFMDTEKVVLYSESVYNKRKYKKKFDLRNLKEGIYSLSMENNLKVIKYQLSVEDKDVKIISKDETYKPIFKRTGDIVYINFLNLDSKLVYIKVYDSENRVLFKEAIKDNSVVEKAINFESAFEDNYTIVVEKEDNRYHEIVLID